MAEVVCAHPKKIDEEDEADFAADYFWRKE
jgi:hypothetical protein